jgi:hypothetical protein
VGAHLEDLRSDFSAIHRIDEIERMPAPRAYSLAYRISAYESVTRARLRARHAKKAAPAGPQEMKASRWLAQNPRALEGISRTKFDLTKGRPHGVQDR